MRGTGSSWFGDSGTGEWLGGLSEERAARSGGGGRRRLLNRRRGGRRRRSEDAAEARARELEAEVERLRGLSG